MGFSGDQVVKGFEQRVRLSASLPLQNLRQDRSRGRGNGATGALEADVGDPVVLELQIDRKPVAAKGIVTVRVAVGVLHAMTVARPPAVVKYDFLIKAFEIC